jgi:diguanylate cyclase (GGDEF)-like protein
MATIFGLFPQEGGVITRERGTGIAGVAVGTISLTLSAALVATSAGPPALHAALVFLGAVGVALIVLIARRRAAPTEPTTILDAGPVDRAVPSADDAIMRFTRDVTRPATFEQLQLLIARQLPLLLGVERAWIVARFNGRQRVILPGPVHDGQEKADALFGGERADWTTFPLTTGDQMVGVLGVEVTNRRMPEPAVAAVRSVGPIIAHALLTADATDRLRETSILDTLTGCATRQHGLERLAMELKRAARSGASLAVLMVDIDHFKSVNDRFGHNAGDAVLTAVGRRMMQTLRASDVRSRWGGEEFLIVLPETGLEPARQVAEALLRRLAETPVQTKTDTIRITASMGLTLARPGEDDIEALIGRADRGLYRAKADGRACVRIVLGDLKGAPIGGPMPAQPLPFRDRRDPNRPDRRRAPGGGRRRTDIWLAAREAVARR